jgi:cytochrome P450
MTLLLAGHHTTGTAAAWILYHLAEAPELAAQISEEARRISDAEGEIRPEDITKAVLANAFVREVLRLYPSAWWFSRQVRKVTKIAGIKLTPGTSLIISPWQMNRDPRFWDKPNEFVPGRSFNNTAYLPFGAGPRKCVGMGLATMELLLLTLELALAFKLTLTNKRTDVLPTPSITLVPPSMRATVSVRTSQSVNFIAA